MVRTRNAIIVALIVSISIGALIWYFYPESEPPVTRVLLFRHRLPDDVTHYTAYDGRTVFKTELESFALIPQNRYFEFDITCRYDSWYGSFFTFKYYREVAKGEFVYVGPEEVYVKIEVDADGNAVWTVK